MKLSERIVWLAGILDGEGNLDLNQRYGLKRRDGGTWSWDRPRIIIASCDPLMIQRISEIYHELGIKFWYQYKPGKEINHSDCLIITTIGNGNVQKVLSRVLPYLTTKKSQAEVLLDYCDWRLRANKDGKSKIERSGGSELVKYYTQLIKELKKTPKLSKISRKASMPLQLPLSSETNTFGTLRKKRVMIESELAGNSKK